MSTGALALVAVTDATTAAATQELAMRGAQRLETRRLGAERVVVAGWFPDEADVWRVVAALRRQGWAAAERPTDDDPRLFAWYNRTRPLSIENGRLVVCLPWAECDRSAAGVVEIDPGGAFGAGNHPTTQLLLEALAARLQGGEMVLDVGCGSGVLAIAAVRLGAAAAVGIDIEAAAVSATRANAERNGVATQVTAVATPLHEFPGTFDVILANIHQDTLMQMAHEITQRLASGGWVGLSGISPAQVSRVAAAFPALRIVATPQLDDWSAIIGAAR
jgi:ribosomal protein L11 methyltransferase